MLSKQEVKKIAKLARIDLTEKEIESFQADLSSVLNYVNKLKEADTTGLEETFYATDLKNVFREDLPECKPIVADRKCEIEKRKIAKELIEAAPRKRDNYIEVPAIF